MQNQGTILIIDDDRRTLALVASLIERIGYRAVAAEDGPEGLLLLESEAPDLLITDLEMPVMNGIEVLQQAKSVDPGLMIMVMTGHGSVKSAVDAMKCGAFDYIEKPVNFDYLKIIVEQAFDRKRLILENRRLQAELAGKYRFDDIIARSESMQKIFAVVEKVAPTDASVLIWGESGTGKELIARAIHAYSLRKDEEFVGIDCVSLPVQLIESELFGYEKGAFTGAAASRPGLLETAQSGTLFMDEITELSVELQARLLRVLQERQFRRVGGRELMDMDVRVIAATKREPAQAVKEGRLREDLFYRLNVIPICLPPLRERRQDIPLLVSHFLKCIQPDQKAAIGIAPQAVAALQGNDWPGNVRELKNMVERLSIMAAGEEITVEDLPAVLTDRASAEQGPAWITELPFKEAKMKWSHAFERQYLEKVLARFDGNISRAAATSGVDRKTFSRLIKKHELARYPAARQ